MILSTVGSEGIAKGFAAGRSGSVANLNFTGAAGIVFGVVYTVCYRAGYARFGFTTTI